jgi:hypothetical protein
MSHLRPVLHSVARIKRSDIRDSMTFIFNPFISC